MRNSKKSSDLVKIVFELENGAATETLWAARLGASHFRIENSPFFITGVSYLDIVLAEPRGEIYSFVGIFKRSGHSTYRLIRTDERDSDAFARAWNVLGQLGCTYEEGPGKLLAVDVPSDADIHAAYAALKVGESSGTWEFEEGHCGHAVG